MSLMPQLVPGDRLVVIADNCSDSTAEIARSLGATVVERSDAERRGKGYALDFGVRFLEGDPPEVVVVVDADCTVNDTFVAHLVNRVDATGMPAQSCNLVTLPANARMRDRLSWFAFLVKNLVRPLGLARLGMPCLMSTGNALPWSALKDLPLASGNLVEDMQLGLDLAIAGYPATFCSEAHLRSPMPSSAKAALGQRTRWEHGHLQTLVTQVPRLFKAALRQRRLDLLSLAMELAVPPLSLLFAMVAIAAVASFLRFLVHRGNDPARARPKRKRVPRLSHIAGSRGQIRSRTDLVASSIRGPVLRRLEAADIRVVPREPPARLGAHRSPDLAERGRSRCLSER